MQIIDKHALDEFIQGDDELLADLATMFSQYLPDMEARMRVAIADRNADALCESAHQMKGRLGYFRATSLQHVASQLERQGQTNDLDDASGTLDQLLNGCKLLLHELSAYTGLSLTACDE